MKNWIIKSGLFVHPWQRLLWNLLASLLSGVVVMVAVLIATAQSLGKVPVLLDQCTKAAAWTVIYIALLTLVTGLAMKRLSRGFLFTATAAVSLTLANHFKIMVTSTPLELYELFQVFQLGPILSLNSKSLSISSYTALSVLLPITWFVVLRLLAKRALDLDWVWSLRGAGAGLAAFLACFLFFADPLIYIPLSVPLTTGVSQSYVYQQCFVPLGLWRSVIFRDTTITAYNQDVMNDVREEIDGLLQDSAGDGEAQQTVQPNVILILSESFFDATSLPGVEFESDPLAEFHALQKESVSGRFYTRSLGYGTCNIELEVLTGVNSRLLSYSDNPIYWEPERIASFPTLPSLFQDEGYYTGFLHMFNDSIYNRKELFSNMGFDDMIFPEDMRLVDPDAPDDEKEFWKYMSQKLSGGYYGDAYLSDILIQLYEDKQEDGPVFLYAVSMENHTPYNADKYDQYDYPFSADLSQEATDTLNAYIQGTANSSKALKQLTNYFSKVDEPTILVFFGDHRPGLGLESGGSVYTELGMLKGDVPGAKPGEMQKLLSTEYLIWANDPSLLRSPVDEETPTSSNYLGLELLRIAGIELPRFWRLVEEMEERSLVYNWSFFVSPQEIPSRTIPGTVDQVPFTLMTYALHDAQKERYITQWLREVAQTASLG